MFFRRKGLHRFINEKVKSREGFRPFAPSVLSEEAGNWFDLGNNLIDPSNASPYMSMTSFVKNSKRHIIPAVTRVDGSSRLQTVRKEDEPLYYQFISTFFKLTGVPMVPFICKLELEQLQDHSFPFDALATPPA